MLRKNSETVEKNDGGTIGSDGLTVGIYTKKGLRRVPTFVNLKSNTMKNIAKIRSFYIIAKF